MTYVKNVKAGFSSVDGWLKDAFAKERRGGKLPDETTPYAYAPGGAPLLFCH